MNTEIAPQTDREILIRMDGRIVAMDSKLDSFKDALKEIVVAFKELETIRIEDHEKRIKAIEKREDERTGIYKFVLFLFTLMGAALTWLLIKLNIK